MDQREIDLMRQLDQAEQLLNLFDALRPDLPQDELYALGLQALFSVSNYAMGSLWVCDDSRYRLVATEGYGTRRATAARAATLDEQAFQALLAACESRGDLHWQTWPLPPEAPVALQAPGDQGHTVLVPLTYTERVGFAALESGAPHPAEEHLSALARYGDKIAVALETAHIFQERQATIDELRRITAEQHQLQATVLELSAPLLPLLPGVLVLPLIGSIDALRAERILEAELGTILRERAEVVLVDITGTSVVDTSVAMQLVRAAAGAQLLGCRTILVGVRPEIAQTLVGLGVDLGGIITRATLADGLQDALRMTKRQLRQLAE